MKPFMLCLLMSLFLWACIQSKQVPDFVVAVKLSKDAAAHLQALGESIKVVADLDGDGDVEPGVNTGAYRNVYLATFKEIADETNIARFQGKTVSKSKFDRLYDKNYYVTINVSSARKVTENNMLRCDVPIDRIENIKNKTLEVHCDLLPMP